MKTHFLLSFLVLILLLSCTDSTIPEKPKLEAYHKSWEHYLGDPSSSQFSSLDQINKSNVSNLKLAWSFRSGGLKEGRTTQIQANPIILDGILYGISAASELFAVDAATGREIWRFESPVPDQTGLGISRGVMSWITDGTEESRIFFSTGPRLFAIRPSDGTLIQSFGEKGSIDLRENLGRDPERQTVVLTTPGVTYKNLLILGLRTSESPGAAPGHIRAFDVLTGEMKWIFHTIPEKGEFGFFVSKHHNLKSDLA